MQTFEEWIVQREGVISGLNCLGTLGIGIAAILTPGIPDAAIAKIFALASVNCSLHGLVSDLLPTKNDSFVAQLWDKIWNRLPEKIQTVLSNLSPSEIMKLGRQVMHYLRNPEELKSKVDQVLAES